VSILASFDVRADRVAVRSEKTMTREKLVERDELENVVLRTNLAMEAAEIKIYNEGDFADFQDLLDAHVRGLIP
jgi:hypothetical protein